MRREETVGRDIDVGGRRNYYCSVKADEGVAV